MPSIVYPARFSPSRLPLSHPLLLACLLAQGVAARQSTVLVPGDQPTLQAAIDQAPAGALILVQTSAAQAPVRIDKALTIMGDPEFFVQIAEPGDCSRPAFELSGPGTGTLTLVGARTVTGEDCYQPPAAITGDGFDELHLYDSSIFAALSGLTGLGYGAPAIAVEIPFLLVAHSTVVGGRDNADDCIGFLPGGGYPAIEMPTGSVTVLDSTVQGGSGGLLCCKFGCSCPPTLAGLGGQGGTGIVAATLWSADSLILGGVGSTFVAYAGNPFVPPQTRCGTQPDGEATLVGTTVELPTTLWDSGPMRIGSAWTLTWDVPAPFVMLFFSPGFEQPRALSSGALAFLPGRSSLLLGAFPGSSPQSLTLLLPNQAALLGLPASFQVLDSALETSRPVTRRIQR